MRINTTPEFFGHKSFRVYRDTGTLLAKGEYTTTEAQSLERDLPRIARTLERTIPEGQHAQMEFCNTRNGQLEYELDIEETTTREYRITIILDAGTYHLEERYVERDNAGGDTPTQINIFGQWKTLAGAIKSYATKGNTTHNGRQPVEIYV